MSDVAVYTIVSGKHFDMAKTLMSSVASFNPGVDMYVLLVEEEYPLDFFAEPYFSTVPVSQLDLPERRRLFFQYGPHEMCCSLKPFAMEWLLAKKYKKVIYFDADICLYSSLSDVISRLDTYDALVTPHITCPLDDQFLPDNLVILQAGTFNAGFLAVRATDAVYRFIQWSKARLLEHCYRDRRLFYTSTDQKWLNLVPALFPEFHVDCSPGLNVAYWNLPHRNITRGGSGFYSNGEPLLFFHFSGFVPSDPPLFSRYDTRFRSSGLPDAVQEIARDYAQRRHENGFGKYSDWKYSFDYFSDKTTYVAPIIRAIYRRNESIRELFGDDPFDMDRDPGFCDSYNKAVFGANNPLTLTALEIYKSDSSLQRLFPGLNRGNTRTFAAWFLTRVAHEYLLDTMFTEPIRQHVASHPYSAHKRLVAKGFDKISAGLKFVVDRGADSAERSQLLVAGKRLSPGFAEGVFQPSRIVSNLLGKVRARVQVETRRKVLSWFLKTWVEAYASFLEQQRRDERDLQPAANLLGDVHGELGLGEGARSTLRAAKAGSIRVNVLPFHKGLMSPLGEALEDVPAQVDLSLYRTNILHVNPDHLHHVLLFKGARFLAGHYNIGYWVWEMGRFPCAWDHARDFFDEIWTASTFCQDVFSRELAVPVVRIPHCVEPVIPEGIGRTDLGLPEKGTIFLTMADMYSTPERKNPVGAIDAFLRAFGPKPRDTYLVVKLSNSFYRPDAMDLIHKYCDKNSSIILMDSHLSRPEVNALIHTCDCLVSLHRAEGFGLPIAEAMFMGKPVIATGWSGNMDFMNITNSFPVKFTIVENPRDVGPYKAGNFWADPDLDHAAELMYHVASNNEHARSIGEHGAREIRENFSCERVGGLIRDRLIKISELTP